MEQKIILKKRDDDYFLLTRTENSESVIGSFEGDDFEYKLSPDNCIAVDRGYDLDELVESKYPNVYNEDYEYDSEAEMLRDEYKSRGFYEGAKAILEILGDKKFSDEDIRKAIDKGIEIGSSNCRWDLERYDYIQSLQQKEWEVEIVMEPVFDIEYSHNGHRTEKFNKTEYRPKLDKKGRIILKRV